MSNDKIKKLWAEEQRRKNLEKAQKNYQEYCELHNKRPVTRRQLLSAGFYGFAASMTAPTLAGMLMPRAALAQAVQCPSAAVGSGLVPFVTLNLSGGAAMSANYVPMDQGRQTLTTYNKMGLGNASLTIQREFGNAPFAGDDGTGRLISQMLQGILNTTSQTTRDRTAFLAVPVRSRDDSSMNPFDASGMVAKAGLVGTDLPNLGRSSTDTGIRQAYANVKPPIPLVVGRYEDISAAISIGGNGALRDMSDEQKVSLTQLVQQLSNSQAQKINNQAGGRMLATAVQCANQKNVTLSQQDPPDLRASSNANPEVANAWGVVGNNNTRDENVVFGSMVLAALRGHAGTVSLELGGYDYHNGTRTTGDQRDLEAGEVMGRVLESAAVLNQKVFLYVTSDGAVVSPESDDRNAVWRSDRGEAGVAYMFAFDPSGRPSTTDFQVGHFTNGQVADDGFVTGNNAALATAAVVANYLQFNNRTDLIDTAIGGVLNQQQLNDVIKFG